MNETLVERLDRIEDMLTVLVNRQTVQEWYDTKTVAEILGKSSYSVREWCRLGRVHAEKRRCGRGTTKEWMISHEEIQRFRAEGLLPLNGRVAS